MLDLLWHCRFRWQLRLEHVTGDTKYGTVENIVAIEKAGIHAYVPLTDCGTRPDCFGKPDFTYDAEQDVYVCPQGTTLHRVSVVTSERMIKYQAPAATCTACPLKATCTTSEKGRIVSRSFDEPYLDRVRAYHAIEAYTKAMCKRKVWVEPLFGEAKQWHGLERFRLRMLEKVNIEGLVRATGQNLKRLLSWRGWGSAARGLVARWSEGSGDSPPILGRIPWCRHRLRGWWHGADDGHLPPQARFSSR
jgi:hypothetical protein